jgi:hypothetical protein
MSKGIGFLVGGLATVVFIVAVVSRFHRFETDVPCVQVLVTAVGFGLAVGLLVGLSLELFSAGFARGPERINTVFKALPSAAALTYFIYQAVAGALFATTSVILELEKPLKESTPVALKLTLERGDNWLARIQKVDYGVSSEPAPPKEYKTVLFPAAEVEPDKGFSLAPKERTSTMVSLPLDKKDNYVTARVVSYAIWWPTPTQSYTRILITRPQ